MAADIYHELFSLKGKTALVTGGAKGVGALISKTLVRAGCRVFISGRSRDAGQRLVDELAEHGECTFLQHDLADAEQVQALARELAEHSASLDILVNNAGTFNAEPLGSVSEKSWDDLMGLNVRTPFLLIQALLPLLGTKASTADPARIINIGSIGGLMPQSNGAYAYGCSKAALHQLTRMLASDLRVRHINVNAIAPGYFPSDMTAGFFEAVPNLEQTMLGKIPAGRFGSQEDIGGMVVFLASRAGAYLTGTVTALDGGFLGAA
ncbi:SDR family oxidoreductase [Pseudomonas sp. 32A]|uniref:SDR family oxidoreductase n=1 Tax=Pseudomonas sp. 32A TaxID=651185 RepID=UPI003A16C973